MHTYKYILLYLLLISNIFSENVFSYFNSDIDNFYKKQNGEKFVYILFVGGVMANSSIDQSIRDFYQNELRNDITDNQSKITKLFGEGDIMIPLMFALDGIGSILKNKELKDMGTNTLRAYLLGAPSMLLMQKITGGSRPNEIKKASHWKFFKDENGVSGHAFMGSIPFFVLSKMNKDNYLGEFFQGMSVATAISRINDDAHYPSQALLGWYMGKLTVDSIFEYNLSDKKNAKEVALSLTGNFLGFYFLQNISYKLWDNNKIFILPVLDNDKYGLLFSKQF